jgi:hypothetical protein
MDLTFEEWIAQGIEKGWCGPPVCYTHDGLPMTEEEFSTDDLDGYCIHIVRMYEDESMKKEIEENHSPSSWRNIYTK